IDIIFPKRDRKNIVRFFEKIVERNHELKDSDSNDFTKTQKEIFSKVKNIVTHDFLIVIISDFYRYDPITIKNIASLSQHNDVILAKVFDPMEQVIPKTKLIAGDGQQQLLVDGANKKIRQRFYDGFTDEFNQFEAEMKKHRIPILKFDTVSDVDEQLKNILKGSTK
ncbi:MAG: DUF58 domain-containing protein, partial [Flavobacteriaceae bacterium]|nr:DUF58 domain-containing protein [Flavobacteriaceae bacterium]